MKYLLLSFIGSLLFLGCQNSDAGPEASGAGSAVDLKTELPGTWEKMGMVIKVNTFEDQDTSFTEVYTEEDLVRFFQTLPTRTFFNVNNKYRMEFRALNGDTISVNRGMWNVFGDTLMLVDPDTTYQFLVRVEENGNIQLGRTLDWDGDGIEDDDYTEQHRRVSRAADF